MEDLNSLREAMDAADRQLLEAFVRRMDISADIAKFKRANSLPVCDPVREADKLRAVAVQAGEKYAHCARRLYETLFALSREYQTELLYEDEP